MHKISSLPLNVSKMAFFSYRFGISEQKFSYKKKFSDNPTPKLPPTIAKHITYYAITTLITVHKTTIKRKITQCQGKIHSSICFAL